MALLIGIPAVAAFTVGVASAITARQIKRMQTWHAWLFLQRRATAFGIDFTKKINIAFCGDVGAGKSSLINVLLQVPDASPLGAIVDELEVVARMKPFEVGHDELANIVLWDVPGAGTQNHPAKTYFADNCLGVFDVLVVVLRLGGLTESNIAVAKDAVKNKVPLIFVISQFDVAVRARLKRAPLSPDEAETIPAHLAQQTRSRFLGDLERAIPELQDPKLFIVSTQGFSEYPASLGGDYFPQDEVAFVRELQIAAAAGRGFEMIPGADEAAYPFSPAAAAATSSPVAAAATDDAAGFASANTSVFVASDEPALLHVTE